MSSNKMTPAMLAAITGNDKAPTMDDETLEAAKRMDEKACYVPWEDGQHQRARGKDEKATDLIGVPKERRYWGRQNQKRKGHRSNHQEQRTIMWVHRRKLEQS